MKQIALKKLTGKIVVKTGLHIGAGNDRIEISGMDNPIIRNPVTQEPYIPGSSIKGKMRTLLEWLLQKIPADGTVHSCSDPECPICRVFGAGNSKNNEDSLRGPTRIIVRDAVLSNEWSQKMKEGERFVEEKMENSINRITAVANPRPIERVIPGVTFDFEIVYRIIDTGDNGQIDEKNFDNIVLKGIKALQNDYLGGGGSRGNGQIEFTELKDENGNDINL